MISKSERSELRSVVKQQFKVLRAEIAQREAELRSDAQAELERQVGTEDTQWNGIYFLATEAVKEANRKVNDALREQGMGHADDGLEYSVVSLDWRFKSFKGKTDHGATKARLELEIRERVKRAQVGLERQEADLLRTLATGAIESEEARAFLNAIPTVGELVPAIRVAELITGSEAT